MYLDNKLGPDAGLAIAKALQANHTLTDLNLCSNGMEADAGQEFAIVIRNNRSLHTLILEGTNNLRLILNSIRK